MTEHTRESTKDAAEASEFVPGTPMVWSRLLAAATDIGWVGKTGQNKDQGYSFRGIDEILKHVAPAFRKRGVIVIPDVRKYEVLEHQFRGGGQGTRVVVIVAFTFVCVDDGSKATATTIGEGLDSSDKAANKAMSQAFKYALNQTLALPTDEPDPDSESPQVASPREYLKDELEARGHSIDTARAWVKMAGKELGYALNTLSQEQVEEMIAWIDVEVEKVRAGESGENQTEGDSSTPTPERPETPENGADGGQSEGFSVETEQWSELMDLLGTDPTVGTMDAIEQRVRRMYSLANRLKVIEGTGSTDPLHVHLMEWYGVEHFGELKVKANYQAFAERAWETAKTAYAEMDKGQRDQFKAD